MAALLLLFVVMLSAAAPVRAQSETQLCITPGVASVPVGGIITVSIEVVNGNNLNAYDLTILYDTEVVTLESWGHGDYLTNLAVVKKVQEPGSFRLVVTQLASPGVSGDGTLLNLVFRGIQPGSSDVTLQAVRMVTTASEAIFPALSGAVITVSEIAVPSFTPTNTLSPQPTFTLTPTLTPTRTPTIPGTYTPTRPPMLTGTPIPGRTETALPMAASATNSGSPITNQTPLPTGQEPTGGGISGTIGIPSQDGSPGVGDSVRSTENIKIQTPVPVDQKESLPGQLRLNNLLWGSLFTLLAILAGMIILFVRRRKPGG